MEELRFIANNISTDDAYYLHFSNVQCNPDYYIVLQGRHSSISVRARQMGDDFVGRIRSLSLDRNSITFNLFPHIASGKDGLSRIVAEFNVDDNKYEAICRQLWEILGYQRSE